MQKLGAAASCVIEEFAPNNLLRFSQAYKDAGGRDESWAKAVVTQRVREYTFPSISLEVALNMQVPVPVKKDTIGEKVTSGTALWEGSFALAEFLSRHSDLAQIADVGI